MSDARGFMALDWVRDELDGTLKQAQASLEALESGNDATDARECLSRLHQVHGTLQMVELPGAARFAAELEALAQALMDGTLEDVAAAQEALMEGILQISTHLDRVQRGGSDELGPFRSLINRMRAARGAKPEEVASGSAADGRAIATFREANGAESARFLRLKFQRAMLALLRRTQPPERLWPYFDRLFTKLEAITPPSHLARLWGLAAGAMERQRAAGTVDAAPLLPMLRGLDAALRRLSESPEQSLGQPPPEALVSGLGALFEPPWESDTARIIALRRQWASANSEDDFAIGADDATIATVAAALHEELAGICDQLDLFARGSVNDSAALGELADVLQRVAGTLSVVGLDDLRIRISDQIEGVEALARGEPLNDDTVMDVASAVLEVDGRLMALAGIDSEEGEHIPGSLSDAHAAVLREVRGSLDGVKQSIVDFITSDWEHAHLSPIAGTLGAVRSVLGIIPLERASDLVECCRLYLQNDILAEQRVPEWQRLDTLADAITSIDYYLERMLDDRSVPDPRLLDIAEESVRDLGYPSSALAGRTTAPPAARRDDDSEEPGGDDDGGGHDGGGGGGAGPGSGELATADAEQNPDLNPDPRDAAADGGWQQPERLRSEADDEALSLQASGTTFDAAPAWQDESEPSASASLDFDMAQGATPADTRSPWSAAAEGEFAQQDSTTSLAFELHENDSDATLGGPGLVEDPVSAELQDWDAPAGSRDHAEEAFDLSAAESPADTRPQSGSARDWDEPSALTGPTEPSFDLSADPDVESAGATISAALDTGVASRTDDIAATGADAPDGDDEQPLVDQDIIEVFLEEVSEVLAQLDARLPELLANPSDSDALAEVRRAFHTLKGSGRMVGAALLGELAWSVENMLNRVIDGTIAASVPVLELIQNARASVPPLQQAFAERRNPDVDVQRLMENADILASGGTAEDLQDGDAADDDWDDDEAPITADDDFLLDTASDDAPPVPRSMAESTSAPEPELLEIFDQEAGEHLTTLRDYLAEGMRNGYAPPLADSIRRALHTLKGSAGMAELPGLADLAQRLEGIVRGYLEIQREADASLMSVLELGVERIEAIREQLQQLGSEPVFADADAAFGDAADSLAQELDQALAARERAGVTLTEVFHADGIDTVVEGARVLDDLAAGQASPQAREELAAELVALGSRAEGAGETAIVALATAYAAALRGVGEKPDAHVMAQLRSGHDELMNRLDALAAGLEVVAADDVVAALQALPLNDAAGSVEAGDEGPGLDEPDAFAAEGFSNDTAFAAPPADDDLASLDLDPDMLEIFFEETDELLHDIEGSLADWPSPAARDGVMRALHTLKGGARMAGLVGLGSRVHELESWLETTADADPDVKGTLQESVDELVERVAGLRRGDAEPASAALSPTGNEVSVDSVAPLDVAEPSESDFDLGDLGDLGDLDEPVAEQEPVSAPGWHPEPEQRQPAEQDRDPGEPIAEPDSAEADPEILALFLEEARELAENLDATVTRWQQEPDNELHLEALLRDLHTLKGGARMAGLTALGDATHDLETVLAGARNRSTDAGFLSEIHAAMDALVARVSALDSGQATGPAAAAAPQPEPAPRAPVAREVVAPDREAPPSAVPKSAAEAPLKEAPQEMIRVAAGLLDGLVSLAGESSIMRGRIQQQVVDTGQALEEMAATIDRIRQQVRRVELETEAQVLFRREKSGKDGYEDFDPLEMDRYTQLQELARTLAESASDVSDLRQTLVDRARDTDTLLLQQGRIHTDLSEGLMRTRMVPFSRLLPRLQRIVRQVGRELSKSVNLRVRDAEGELDRNILERMIPPLEHMLRNAIDHGIESAEVRAQRGKPAVGTITLRLAREGGEILVEVSDDGGGIDAAAVRTKAIERGLLAPDAQPSDEEVLSFIMAPGFSTARAVTQISGRGVGMDVVNSEVRQMGGSIGIASVFGEGSRFTVRLPFTVSINRALMVTVGEDEYALPLNSIEGIVRVSPADLRQRYADDEPGFNYAGRTYGLSYLGTWLSQPARVRDDVPSLPVLMVRSGDHGRAVHVDAIAGSREIVVKNLGPQFAGVQGLSGATILGDGRVVVILDLPTLLRGSAELALEHSEELRPARQDARTKRVLVVDDSVTVRKVTTRLLERQGMEVSVAKDGVEAVSVLQELRPDVMLLDIEMPRMDGFEVARHVRNDDALKDLPIIMITSRTGDKHRERAALLKVNRFLGKPFQEAELLSAIEELTA